MVEVAAMCGVNIVCFQECWSEYANTRLHKHNNPCRFRTVSNMQLECTGFNLYHNYVFHTLRNMGNIQQKISHATAMWKHETVIKSEAVT